MKTLGKLIAWLSLWPVLIPLWLLKRGRIGKVAAGIWTLFLVVVVAAALSSPSPSTNGGTADRAASVTKEPTQVSVAAKREDTPASVPTVTREPTPPPAPTDTPATPASRSKTTSLIEVQFSAKARVDAGEVYFDVETNLPDGMEFMFTVEGSDGIMGQDTREVAAGTMTAGPFTNKGDPYPPGEYTVNISSPLVSVQPPEVQRILGESGKNMHGQFVSNGRVDYTMPFTIEGSASELQALAEGKASELKSLQAHHAFLKDMESQLALAGKPRRFDDLLWAKWSADWNRRLKDNRAAFSQEFGANINEYKGHCRDAFLNIGIAYSTLFILWQDYDGFLLGRRDQATLDSQQTEFEQLLTGAESALETCSK